MNKLGIVGVVLLAALVALFAMRNFIASPPEPSPPPPRAIFDATQPLRIEVHGEEAFWMTRELRNLVARSKLNLVSFAAQPAAEQSFTLRIEVRPAQSLAGLTLVAPDGIVDRSELLQLPQDSQLATMRRLAERLPGFLGLEDDRSEWPKRLGTEDAAAYATFLDASDALFAEVATGFTAPSRPSHRRAATLERLERVTRRHRDFARARALLALGYLSLGGEDADSLTRLAETAAQRALTADPELADAHAALGIVYARKLKWAAAQEHLETALALDAGNVAALEALGCLLLDAGRVDVALPHAQRAASLQPGNRGAQQCATYAHIATRTESTGDEPTADSARIQAAVLLLESDRPHAETLLREHKAVSDELIRAVIDASRDRGRVPDALRVITRSADEEIIDVHTETLFGTALRRPDFVFNRMLRQLKAGESAPLRLLWLPQTEFLRKHPRFREIVNAAALTTYWQKHGLPSVCSSEPAIYGCALKRAR
jgi:tetratricopeptide (TPR) repeat protein